MNNVHGFNNINRNNQNNNQRNNYQNLNNNISDNIPFMNNYQGQRAPLDETVPYTLKIICCPQLRLLSVSVILSLVMVAVYVVCCFQGISKQHAQVLEIQVMTLIDFGAMQDILLRKGQIYRLITASLLHKNLLHIVMNLMSFIFLLSRLEKNYHSKILLPILLISSISGFLLSALCNPANTVSAGSSTMILGVIGTYLAFMTINWQTLAAYRDIRSQLCCTIGVLVFFALLFSFGSEIDMYGHLGGMFGGYLMSLAILPGIQQKRKVLIMVGIVGVASSLLLTTLLFFFVTD